MSDRNRPREDRPRDNHSRDRVRRPSSPRRSSRSPKVTRHGPSLQPRPKGELGYTGRSLNERFATKYDPLDFTPEDNISVAIERNIKGNAEAKVRIGMWSVIKVLTFSLSPWPSYSCLYCSILVFAKALVPIDNKELFHLSLDDTPKRCMYYVCPYFHISVKSVGVVWMHSL